MIPILDDITFEKEPTQAELQNRVIEIITECVVTANTAEQADLAILLGTYVNAVKANKQTALGTLVSRFAIDEGLTAPMKARSGVNNG